VTFDYAVNMQLLICKASDYSLGLEIWESVVWSLSWLVE